MQSLKKLKCSAKVAIFAANTLLGVNIYRFTIKLYHLYLRYKGYFCAIDYFTSGYTSIESLALTTNEYRKNDYIS